MSYPLGKFGAYAARLSIAAALFSIALLCSLSPVRGATLYSSGLSLGDAGPSSGYNWAVFSLGGANNVSGGVDVDGSVGVAGSGSFTISGGSNVSGGLYYHSGGSYSISGGSTITKGENTSTAINNILTQGVTDAKTLSTKASALSSTGGPSSITSSTTLGSGNGSSYVFKLSNFSLSGGSTVVLDGNSSSSFVFDITGTFALSGGARVVLEGGVTASNVLFNYTGSSSINFSGGTTLTGIILAAGPSNYSNSSVNVSGGVTVNGEIIADKVTLSGGSIINEQVVSP